MFYCEFCRRKKNWPTSFMFSYGKCEMCGKVAECYDCPCSSLPDPDKKKEPPPPPVKFKVTEEDWPMDIPRTYDAQNHKRVQELEAKLKEKDEQLKELKRKLNEALVRADKEPDPVWNEEEPW